MDITMEQLKAAHGAPVFSSDGDKIGVVEEIFTDVDTGRPEWIGIGTGFLRTKRVLVPVAGADLRREGFFVPYPKEHVKGSPDIDDDQIAQQTERALYDYYGVPYSESTSDTTLAEGAPRAPAGKGGSVVRSEEQLLVGKESVPTGGVRLRKWVETEPVEADVKLRRETAVVEREPIEQPVADAEFGAQEVEVPLEAERPVVGKQAVAKERISVKKGVREEDATVRDDLRKERVGVEGEEDPRSAG